MSEHYTTVEQVRASLVKAGIDPDGVCDLERLRGYTNDLAEALKSADAKAHEALHGNGDSVPRGLT